ncbi:MAG: hypothetical protein ACRYG7_06370 [Janthinobacterium lividum]
MEADDLAFLEDLLETSELLDCATCQEKTLYAQEEAVSTAAGVTELVMRCGGCMNCRAYLRGRIAASQWSWSKGWSKNRI